jgi:hypothetical protein
VSQTPGAFGKIGRPKALKEPKTAERPRVRTTDDEEVRLGRYEMFHRGEPLTETV